jgi:hypothetical protein
MLDKISQQMHVISEAYDFADLAAEAMPQSAAFFHEIQALLMGKSAMEREAGYTSGAVPETASVSKDLVIPAD